VSTHDDGTPSPSPLQLNPPKALSSGQPHAARRTPWNPFQGPPPRGPPVTGLAWSSDGFQLAALDAGSGARMWCMRPERGGWVGAHC